MDMDVHPLLPLQTVGGQGIGVLSQSFSLIQRTVELRRSSSDISEA